MKEKEQNPLERRLDEQSIEALKHTLHIKMAEELREKADKGEATVEDAMAALMLAAIMKKESEED